MIINEPSSIYSLMNDKVVPFGVSVEVTARCNVDCIHCYHLKTHAKELDTGEMKKLLDDLSALGAVELTFTGGEPLMRSDFSFILKYAVEEKGFSVKVFSNLTLLEETMADVFASLPVNSIETSILGPDSRIHDSITCVPGSFDATIRGIKMLKERNVRVAAKTIVMKSNFKSLNQIMLLMKDMGIPFKYDDGIFIQMEGSREPLSHSISRQESRSIKALQQKNKTENISACNAAKCVMSISPDGFVFPCGPFPVPAGSVRETPLGEIWFGSPLMKLVRSIKNEDYKACGECFFKEECNGCMAMGMGLSSGRIHPCFLARKKLKSII